MGKLETVFYYEQYVIKKNNILEWTFSWFVSLRRLHEFAKTHDWFLNCIFWWFNDCWFNVIIFMLRTIEHSVYRRKMSEIGNII